MFTVISWLLWLVQSVLLVRIVVDLTESIATPQGALPGSRLDHTRSAMHAVTEPIAAPVRRRLPPGFMNWLGVDVAVTLIFLVIALLRIILP